MSVLYFILIGIFSIKEKIENVKPLETFYQFISIQLILRILNRTEIKKVVHHTFSVLGNY